MSTPRYAAVLVIACSCGGDATPRDATTPDQDNGTCGGIRFTGEYIDWDSREAAFCGIFGAQFQDKHSGASSTTAPNGRFDLCLPDAELIAVSITPPSTPSQCSQTPETYTIPGLAIASKAVIAAGGAWSGRGFGISRQTVDLAKAQLFVHVNGTPPAISIAAMHGTAQARANDTWAPGNTGQDVFFPDVDPGNGATLLSAAGALGAGSIPLAVGQVTYVSIIAR